MTRYACDGRPVGEEPFVTTDPELAMRASRYGYRVTAAVVGPDE